MKATKRLRFSGDSDLFWMNLLFVVTGFPTLGVMWIFGFYWNVKYIVNHIEVVEE